MYQATSATKKIAKLKKRIRAVQGGTSASKTVSILIYLIARAQQHSEAKHPTLTSVVAESFPHLRRGAMRDFLQIMQAQHCYVDSRWDRTNSIYTFETGSQIEFFSVDQPEKVRGARRDRLFINECNNIPFEAFEELEVRTREFIFLDWNPTNEFWFYEHVLKREDCEHIILTYLDNEALDEQIKASIESRRERAGWWRVYGQGLLGEVEGRIYTGWATVDDVPHEARLERYGIDFGYSNDPTAIVAIYYYNGGYIIDEIAFLKGLSNKQIADILLNQPKKALAIADSAEPKSIDEIRSYGVSIQPTLKGKDSVRQGIQLVQDQTISMTARSHNLHRAYKNYLWAVDKLGKPLSPNEPDHLWSDGMDAIRYGMSSLVPMIQRLELINMMPRLGHHQRKNPAR